MASSLPLKHHNEGTLGEEIVWRPLLTQLLMTLLLPTTSGPITKLVSTNTSEFMQAPSQARYEHSHSDVSHHASMEEEGGLTEMELPLDCMSHRIKTSCHSLELAIIPWSWLLFLGASSQEA